MSAKPLKLLVAGQALIERPVIVHSAAAQALSEVIRGADAAVCNFEATLAAPHSWPLKSKTLHASSVEAMASLRALGFDALALANNHAFDLGPPGMKATREGATACGFAAAGSGENAATAAQPAVMDADGTMVAMLSFDLGPQPDIVYAGVDRPGINPLRIRQELVLPAADAERLAVIARDCGYTQKMKRRIEVGYSEAQGSDALDFFGVRVRTGSAVSQRRYPDAADLQRALNAVKAAHEQAQLVIVSCHHHHWDADWSATPEWLTQLGTTLVDTGADLVFFHGAPVLQGMSLHRGRPIFHGMGNFIFHTARASRYDDHAIDVWRSVIALCDFEANRLSSVRIWPIRVGPPLDKSGGDALLAPETLSGPEADRIVTGFLARSRLDGHGIVRDHSGCVLSLER